MCLPWAAGLVSASAELGGSEGPFAVGGASAVLVLAGWLACGAAPLAAGFPAGRVARMEHRKGCAVCERGGGVGCGGKGACVCVRQAGSAGSAA